MTTRGVRILRTLALQLLVVVVALAALWWAMYGGRSAMRAGRGPRPGVETVTMRIVSAFVLDAGPGRVALIDTGTYGGASRIVDALHARGLGPDAVQAIFLSHHHRDHIGGLRRFPGARVYAMSAERDSIVRRGGRVTDTLVDGQTVSVGPLDVRVYAVPGHTAGSAAFLAHDTLFLGDAASVRSDGTVRPPGWLFTDNLSQAVASLHGLSARLRAEHVPVAALAFSHSGPIEIHPLELLGEAR